MKEKKINSTTTFYDILVSKDGNLVSCIRKKNIADKLKEGSYKKEFPECADEIEDQYQKGKERADLLDKSGFVA